MERPSAVCARYAFCSVRPLLRRHFAAEKKEIIGAHPLPVQITCEIRDFEAEKSRFAYNSIGDVLYRFAASHKPSRCKINILASCLAWCIFNGSLFLSHS